MIAGMPSALTQVKAIVHDLEALYFRLLGVQSFLPPDDAELDPSSEADATDPAARLRTAIACVLKDSLEPAIRDLETAASPSSHSDSRDDEETWDESGRDLNGSGKRKADVKKLRATPIEMELASPDKGDDAYPDGHWVRASTNLIFPAEVLYPDENLDDEIYCALLSPGAQVGGKAGGDKEAAFQAEAHVLARMLIHLGIIITEEAV